MANYTIADGYAYLTSGTYTPGSPPAYGSIADGSGVTVKIAATKVTVNWTNPLIKIPKPIPSKDDSSVVETYLINLRRITNAIIVDGKLHTTGSDDRDTFYDNLETLANGNDLYKFIWRNNTAEKAYDVMIEKVGLDYDKSLSKYTIKMNLIVGVEKGV